MRKCCLFLLLLLVLFIVPVYAEDPAPDVSDVEEELSDEAREISGRLVTDGSYDVSGAIGRLIRKGKAEAEQRLREEMKELAKIIAIALVCAVAEAVCPENRSGELISICACAAVSVAVTGSVDSFAGQMTDTLQTVSDYSRAVLPAVYTAAAVSGAVVSAGASYAAVLLGLNILMEMLRRLAVPMIYAYLALGISRSIYPNAILNTVIAAIKWAAATGITLLTMGISAYIGMTGALTGPADAAAVKGAKLVISNTLPLVGGILSDAASVVLSSAAVIKNAAGVFALIGICAMCLTPFIAIGVKMLLFRLCAAVASALEGKRLAMLLGDLSNAFGMMLGVMGCLTIMLFVSFMAAIRTVSV